MAAIDWHEGVWQLFNDHVDYARFEFGKKTANKWLKEMSEIDKRLRMSPLLFLQIDQHECGNRHNVY